VFRLDSNRQKKQGRQPLSTADRHRKNALNDGEYIMETAEAGPTTPLISTYPTLENTVRIIFLSRIPAYVGSVLIYLVHTVLLASRDIF
jgi:hypothetical protein